MATFDQLGRQLESLHELQQIVRTMKTLSAVHIHQYEQATRALADYFRTVELGLHVALKHRDGPEGTRMHLQRGVVSIVFGTDHGLCGRFNEDIAEYTVQYLAKRATGASLQRVLAVGGRVSARLEQAGQSVDDEIMMAGSASRISKTVQQILLKIDEWHSGEQIERVIVFHNLSASNSRYRPRHLLLLPVNLARFRRLEYEPWPSKVLPQFSMDREELLSHLLRQYLYITLFRACAESQASEHSSRLAAMRSAEKNIQERVEDVEVEYRRARQGIITSELLDITAGFEAFRRK